MAGFDAGAFDAGAFDAVAVAGVSGTLTLTLDGVTVAASATTGHSATGAATLDGISVAASGTTGHPASAAFTLDGVVVDASGVVDHSASLAVTLDDVDVAISGIDGAARGTGNNFAGGRRGYIIRDKRYWLNDFELAHVLAQIQREAEQVSRAEVLQDAPKPKTLSRRTWKTIKATLASLEALSYPEPEKAEEYDETDDEEVLMLL